MVPPRQSGAASSLIDFVRLNEGIKNVVMAAFQINLMALNAILMARRAGSLALGFGVISQELRLLAVELTQQMDAVSRLASEAVGLISRRLGQEKRLALLQRASDGLVARHPGLEAMLRRQRADNEARVVEILQLRQQLLMQLEDTRRLCEFGMALARAAKIEAAYGQIYQQALAEVSCEFADKTQQILPAIETLCREMHAT